MQKVIVLFSNTKGTHRGKKKKKKKKKHSGDKFITQLTSLIKLFSLLIFLELPSPSFLKEKTKRIDDQQIHYQCR